MPLFDTDTSYRRECFAREFHDYHQQAQAERRWIQGGPAPSRIMMVNLGPRETSVRTARIRWDDPIGSVEHDHVRRLRLTPCPRPSTAYMSVSTALALDGRSVLTPNGGHDVLWVIGAPIFTLVLGAATNTLAIGVPTALSLRAALNSAILRRGISPHARHLLVVVFRDRFRVMDTLRVAADATLDLREAFGTEAKPDVHWLTAVTLLSLRALVDDVLSHPHLRQGLSTCSGRQSW